MLRSLALALLLLATLLWTLIFVTMPERTLAADVDGTTATSTVITVTTTIDELNTDGDCALREALQAAYTDASVDNCPAGSGGDAIYLPAGTYKLLIDQLHLTGTVSLVGSLTGATILDGNFHRVLYIYPSAIVTLLRLQITNGRAPTEPCPSDCTEDLYPGAGGGIANYGRTTIIDSTIYGNKAGIGEQYGMDMDGVFSGAPGGGIYNQNILTLTNSTVSNNAAGDGFYRIQGPSQPIICAYGGDGGGIYSVTSLTLENVTVTENEPGKTAYIAEICGLDPKNKQGRVGGVYSGSAWVPVEGSVFLKNTIVAGNAYGDCGGGTIISLDHNLIQNFANCKIEGPYVHRWADLGPLHANGGPTLTHELNPHSPAINRGICTNSAGIPVTTDQRGEARPQGGLCDLGAVESPYTQTVKILNLGLPFVKR